MSGCWEWLAGKTEAGYGKFTLGGGVTFRAHRLMWELVFGEIPEGLCVLHTCDSPPCCNPRHLWLGTQGQNVDDMTAKGRWGGGAPPGEAHGRAKLSAPEVAEIRDRWANGGVLQKELATEFGVSKTTIGEIVHRKIWQHVA